MLPNKLNFYPEDKLTFINKVNCFLLFATNLDRKEFPNKEIHQLDAMTICYFYLLGSKINSF